MCVSSRTSSIRTCRDSSRLQQHQPEILALARSSSASSMYLMHSPSRRWQEECPRQLKNDVRVLQKNLLRYTSCAAISRFKMHVERSRSLITLACLSGPGPFYIVGKAEFDRILSFLCGEDWRYEWDWPQTRETYLPALPHEEGHHLECWVEAGLWLGPDERDSWRCMFMFQMLRQHTWQAQLNRRQYLAMYWWWEWKRSELWARRDVYLASRCSIQ